MNDRMFTWLLFLLVVLVLFSLMGYGCAIVSQSIWAESIGA